MTSEKERTFLGNCLCLLIAQFGWSTQRDRLLQRITFLMEKAYPAAAFSLLMMDLSNIATYRENLISSGR